MQQSDLVYGTIFNVPPNLNSHVLTYLDVASH
jgi:hypothetical protein